jgi:hypothetical protein
MANSDKNIVITPNIGQTADPKIVFSGADASTAAQDITLSVYPTSNGTLSFEGTAGQIFSITNDLTGTIFSVNDVSGIPSIEVDDDGTIRLAEFGGNVLIGTAVDDGVNILQVDGIAKATGYSETVYSLSGTALSTANGGIQTKILAGNTTLTDSLASGESIVLQIENGSTYTVTWPTILWVTSSGNVAPTLTAKDVIVLWKVSTTLYGARVGSYV